jgi:hypothetical protein
LFIGLDPCTDTFPETPRHLQSKGELGVRIEFPIGSSCR